MRGWRANLTDIDATHRVHARLEDCVCTSNDTHRQIPLHLVRPQPGLAEASLTTATLLAWLAAAHPRQRPRQSRDPAPLRYRVLHAAARLTRSGRRRHLKIAATWP